MRYTLKTLLQDYKVLIPQIQRDYAQGRESEKEIRRGFVKKIMQACNDEDSLNLDFVYGYTESSGAHEVVFIPLDGQQRLTTLWLLHWFLAPRIEGHIGDDVKTYLSKFTYETRVSSKRFCSQLVDNPAVQNEGETLSSLISDAPWFMASWKNDLTVKSMLTMMDTIQSETIDAGLAWKNLVTNERITFDFIDIKSDEFKLTDELYIKMNSRGKPLTPFENFKAQFSSLLASKQTDFSDASREFDGSRISYQQYFAFKIDSSWMDLFWGYRKKTDNAIDQDIYRFISFIAEFLFFRKNETATSSDLKEDFEFLNEVFSYKENVDFLFDTLDFLSSLPNVDTYFKSAFNGVPTFDSHHHDFFLRAITDIGFEVKDKVILYTILAYSAGTKEPVDEKLRTLIRIVRNMLVAVRQPNQSKRIEYTSNLRLPSISNYCAFIDSFIGLLLSSGKSAYEILSNNPFMGFTKEIVAHEQLKASLISSNPALKSRIHQLEDHPELLGNLSNFKLVSKDIENKIDAFLQIWDESQLDSLIIRAFLSVGDYSVKTHEYSSLGEIRFFGCKNHWHRVLTTTEKTERMNVSDKLDEFLTLYCQTSGTQTNEKLKSLVDEFNSDTKAWRYYFIKYASICENKFLRLNTYTWSDKTGFGINHLGNSGYQPLHSYHLNPYLIALKYSFVDDNRIGLNWGRFSDLSSLIVKGKLTLSCMKTGWLVKLIDDYAIETGILEKYGLTDGEDGHLLSVSIQDDRIQVATELINDLLNE